MAENKLSIIVPCHHTRTLAALRQSLQAQQGNISYEVLVIANPPNKALAREIGSGPARWRYLSTEKIGVNNARNIGIQAASAPWILFLDDDCILNAPDYLQRLLDFLESNPQSFIGGIYEIPPNSSLLDQTYNLIQRLWLEEGFAEIPGHNQYLIGGNFSGPTKILSRFLFDEAIAFGGSETELFLRMGKSEGPFILDNYLSVLHRSHLSLRSFLYKAYKQGFGSSYIKRKGLVVKGPQRTFASQKIREQIRRNTRQRLYIYLYERFFILGATCEEQESATLLFKIQKIGKMFFHDLRFIFIRWDQNLSSKIRK